MRPAGTLRLIEAHLRMLLGLFCNASRPGFIYHLR